MAQKKLVSSRNLLMMSTLLMKYFLFVIKTQTVTAWMQSNYVSRRRQKWRIDWKLAALRHNQFMMGLVFLISEGAVQQTTNTHKKGEGEQNPEHIKGKNGYEDRGRQGVIWRVRQVPARTETREGERGIMEKKVRGKAQTKTNERSDGVKTNLTDRQQERSVKWMWRGKGGGGMLYI